MSLLAGLLALTATPPVAVLTLADAGPDDRRCPTWLAFSPDGKTLAARFSDEWRGGRSDDRLVVWEVAGWAERRRWRAAAVDGGLFARGPTGAVAADGRCLVPSPTGVRVLAPNGDAGRPAERPVPLGYVWLTGDGTTAYSLAWRRRFVLNSFPLADPEAVRTRLADDLPGDERTLHSTAAALDPSARRLALTGDADAADPVTFGIDLWDVPGRKRAARLTGYGVAAHSLAFSADGKTLAAGGSDGSVRLWDVAAGKERAVLAGPLFTVTQLAFAAGDRRLVFVTTDRTGSPNLWVADPAAGAITARVVTGTTGFLRLAVSPDGRLAAAGGTDAAVRVWGIGRP